jgi:hypothetical protein
MVYTGIIKEKEIQIMIKAEKVFKYGDLVHCTSLSKGNVEKLVLGRKYRIIAVDNLDGTRLYTLSDGINTHVYTSGRYIGYITEKVNYPVGKKSDAINPSHYTDGGIETIDYLKAKMSTEEFHGFLRGNVLKYMSRAGKKDDVVQELEKAQWYLTRLISELKTETEVDVQSLYPSVPVFEDAPMTEKQKQFIAGLCARLGLERTDLPSEISLVSDYHYLSESQATELIDKLIQM